MLDKPQSLHPLHCPVFAAPVAAASISGFTGVCVVVDWKGLPAQLSGKLLLRVGFQVRFDELDLSTRLGSLESEPLVLWRLSRRD